MPPNSQTLGLPGAMYAYRTAQDPNAAPEALQRIAHTYSPRDFFAYDRSHVRHYRAAKAVASHPNAPLAALLHLAPYFPSEVSENPSLQLELATYGAPVDQYDIANLYFLLTTRKITPAFHGFLETLWYQLGKPLIPAYALGHHPDTSEEVLADAVRLRTPTDDPIGSPAFEHHIQRLAPDSWKPYTHEDAFRSVRGLSLRYEDAIAYLAHYRLLGLEVIGQFFESPSIRRPTEHTALVALAYHPDTDEEHRAKLIAAFGPAEIKYVSPETNPLDQGLQGIPQHAAFIMCLHAIPDANALVALTPNLPEPVTQHLLLDLNPAVRGALALNPTTPAWALQELLGDANTRVRATAQRHPQRQVQKEP